MVALLLLVTVEEVGMGTVIIKLSKFFKTIDQSYSSVRHQVISSGAMLNHCGVRIKRNLLLPEHLTKGESRVLINGCVETAILMLPKFIYRA
jgi:hypothetical protein